MANGTPFGNPVEAGLNIAILRGIVIHFFSPKNCLSGKSCLGLWACLQVRAGGTGLLKGKRESGQCLERWQKVQTISLFWVFSLSRSSSDRMSSSKARIFLFIESSMLAHLCGHQGFIKAFFESIKFGSLIVYAVLAVDKYRS